LPQDIDYLSLDGITIEAREKLARIRPHSLGQASRIAGVSPADLSMLTIFLQRWQRAGS
jgi:tRNA uridine 5-carboxymethylaminomethyl modification enzyme